MHTFLVSFSFHEVKDRILAEMTKAPFEPQQTSLYISGENEEEVLGWAHEVASTFMARVNESEGWAQAGHACWIEKDPASAGWEGAEGFLQAIRVHEYPDFDALTHEAYVDWLEEHGNFDV
ncbi:MAG TPA: hypothetical protein VGH80_05075 [Xanthomonadaceae bacterium]|jgi:hypothetical protein